MKTRMRAELFMLTLILVLLQCACSGAHSVGDDNTTAVTMVTPPFIAQPVATPTPAADCAPSLSSAHGSVPFGDKACSPDKMLFAREEEPKNLGHIGLYDRNTDQRLKLFKVTQQPEGDGPNEIKGLAWSPDSRLLAVMYHQSGGGSVSILDVKQGTETDRLNIKGQPHSIEFISQTKVKAGDETLEIR